MQSRRRVRVTLFAALAAAHSVGAIAQSPFSTAKADGSIVLDRGGFVQASFGETLFRVAYELDRRDAHADVVRKRHPAAHVRFGPRYGFEVQARPSGKVASLIDENELVSGGRAVVSFGLGNVISFQPSANESASGKLPAQPLGLIYDWFTVQASIERTSFTLYDPVQPYASQFSTRDFRGFALSAHYNAEFGGAIPTVAGLSFGVKRTNNADELPTLTVNERRTFTAPDGMTERTYDRTRKGLGGTYEEQNQITLNTDLVFYPFLVAPRAGGAMPPSKAKASVAFNLFSRNRLGSDGRFVPGVGAYVTAPGAPLKVYGGVNVYRGTDKGVSANVVAGFNF